MPDPVVTYFAKSILVSKTVWFNVLGTVVALLQMSDVLAALPAASLKYTTAIVLAGNFILRLYTVRPVAFTLPPEISPVVVAKLAPDVIVVQKPIP